MLVFFAISILVLSVLRFEFVIRFDFCFNAYDKVCSFTLFLFSIRIFESRILHENGGGVAGTFYMQLGKKHLVFTLFNNESKNKLEKGVPLTLLGDIVQMLNITELGTEAKVGDKNALNVTMMMGSVKIFYCSMLSFLRSKRTLKSYESFTPYYDEQVFIVDVAGILKISIADIIFILISTWLKMRYKHDDQISIAQQEVN